MSSGGRDAGITETPKNAETIIRWNCTEEKLVRSVVPARTTRADVKEKAGGRKGVRPETRRHVGVEEQRADTVIKGADDAFGATILLGRVGTSEAEDGVVRRKKVAYGDIVKLFAVVSLQGKDGTTKLGGDIGVKGGECGEGIELATKRKFPYIMRKIIQYHQMI